MDDFSARGGRQGGFTLVELMVTVAIAAVIAMIAVPSFQQMTRRSRLATAGNELVAAMQSARMAAVSQRESVSFCPSADGTTCAAAAGNRWIVLAPGNSVLKDFTLPLGITAQGSPNLRGASFRLVFGPSGFSKAGTGAAAPTSATLALCGSDIRGDNAMDITAAMGRISTARRNATAACSNPGER